MNHTTHIPITLTNRGPGTVERAAELVNSNHRASCEYLPMDIFVDPKTIKEHFQVSMPRTQ